MKKIKKFVDEVTYAFKKVPYYGALLNDDVIAQIKANPEQALNLVPYSSKVDYRKNFPRGILAKGFSPQHPMVISSRSSGTTGERTITLELGMLLLQRALSTSKISAEIYKIMANKDRKIVRFAAPNCSDVECANPNSGMEDRLLPDNTLVLPVYHDLMTTPDRMLDKAIEEVETFKPDLFYVDPTHFAFLLLAYKKRGLTPPQIPVILSYTATTRSARRIINEFFPPHLTAQLLSSTEFGWIAMECPHGHLHVNDDGFFPEFKALDLLSEKETAEQVGFTKENSVPQHAGIASSDIQSTDIKNAQHTHTSPLKELCLTSLDKGACPHIRYTTGDIVSVVGESGEICECGSDRQRMVVEGRISYFLKIHGRPVMSPQQVDAVVGAPQWLNFYQFEQIKDTEFALKLVVNQAYQEEAETAIVTALKNALEPATQTTIKIDTRIVEYISTERSGKFQAVKGVADV